MTPFVWSGHGYHLADLEDTPADRRTYDTESVLMKLSNYSQLEYPRPALVPFVHPEKTVPFEFIIPSGHIPHVRHSKPKPPVIQVTLKSASPIKKRYQKPCFKEEKCLRYLRKVKCSHF